MSQFDNLSFLRVLYKWRIHLTVIILVAAIFGAIFSSSWFIQPKYKSTAVLYPANLTPYANETATEQMLQLMQSADIRSAVCEKFNLFDRYAIDKGKKGSFASLYDSYNENVDIRRTEFESVRIDVYDTDPRQASDMVDTIINLMNLKARALQREKTGEIVKMLKDQLEFKRAQIDSLEGALRMLREKFGLLDYYIQSKEALKMYYKIISKGGSRDRLRDLDTIMRNLENKGAESVSLKQLHQKAFETYAEIRVLYDRAVSDSRKELTYANIVAKPYPADKKSSPIRWVIICASMLSAFVFALIAIIVVENKESLFRKFK